MSEAECPFCQVEAILENDLAYVREDRYPVSPGHLLVLPKRHVVDWFGLSDEERAAVNELLLLARKWLDKQHQPDGYNIGMNCGEAAGQTVFHMHCHLIPRYRGDTANPSGGVRGVMPGKRRYD